MGEAFDSFSYSYYTSYSGTILLLYYTSYSSIHHTSIRGLFLISMAGGDSGQAGMPRSRPPIIRVSVIVAPAVKKVCLLGSAVKYGDDIWRSMSPMLWYHKSKSPSSSSLIRVLGDVIVTKESGHEGAARKAVVAFVALRRLVGCNCSSPHQPRESYDDLAHYYLMGGKN